MPMKKKFVNEVAVIPPEMIAGSLEKETRQYIQGDLQMDQRLPFIYNTKCEIGITHYREFTHDEPHYHDVITETNYVLEGRLCMQVLDTGETFVVEKGGLFSVPPGVAHVLKAQPDTKILFVKDHACNDKHVVKNLPPHLIQWLEDKEF